MGIIVKSSELKGKAPLRNLNITITIMVLILLTTCTLIHIPCSAKINLGIHNQDSYVVKKETDRMIKITQCFIRNEKISQILELV